MTQHAMVPAKALLSSTMARSPIDDAGRSRERWAALRRTLALWRDRARSRADLDMIPGHRLADLPFDTSTIQNERDKPFWKG